MGVLLLRHGATKLNAEGQSADRIRGWLDVPLSPAGRRDAERAAQILAPAAITRIFSSDLKRAAVTAKIWADAAGVKLTLTPALRPWHLGNLAGKPTSEVMEIIKALVAHPDEPAPGGGESFHDFLDRYLSFVLPLVYAPDCVGCVAHLRNVKALEAAVAVANPKRSAKFTIDHIHLPTWNKAPKVQPGEAVYFPSSLGGQSEQPQEARRA